MRNFIVAVDGLSCTGKGALCARLSLDFNLDYLDTGLIYRYLAYIKDVPKINPENITLNDVYSADRDKLRSPEISQEASKISTLIPNRDIVNNLIHKYVNIPKWGRVGSIVDGRDIGGYVLPDAQIKLFLTASPEVRAKRKYAEYKNKFKTDNFSEEYFLNEITERDKRDQIHQKMRAERFRNCSQFVSVINFIDTTELTEEEVYEVVCPLVEDKLKRHF